MLKFLRSCMNKTIICIPFFQPRILLYYCYVNPAASQFFNLVSAEIQEFPAISPVPEFRQHTEIILELSRPLIIL